MTAAQDNLQSFIGETGEAVNRALAESVDVEGAKDMATVLMNFFAMKELYTQLDTVRKKLYHRIDSMDKVVIPTMMDDQGVDKVAVPEIARSFYKLTKHSA